MKVLRILVVAASLAAGAIPQSIAPSFAENEPSPQTSPSPETLQAARDFVAVVNTETVTDTIANLTAQVWPEMETTLRAQNPKIDTVTLAELRQEFERLMAENYAEVMQEAPAVYAKYFTAKEMQDLTAFYRTPVGAKAVRLMPQAMAELNAKTLARMQGLQQKVYLAFLTILQRRGLYAQ